MMIMLLKPVFICDLLVLESSSLEAKRSGCDRVVEVPQPFIGILNETCVDPDPDSRYLTRRKVHVRKMVRWCYCCYKLIVLHSSTNQLQLQCVRFEYKNLIMQCVDCCVELCSYAAAYILQSMQATKFNLEAKRERNFVSVTDCKNAGLW